MALTAPHGTEGHSSEESRAAQVLTAQAVMLALDDDRDLSSAASELERMSRGDGETLEQVRGRVRRLAMRHPGPAVDRTVAIVEAAAKRVASLRKLASSERRTGGHRR